MQDIYITAYGATDYIGKSAFLLHDKDRHILLDCGLQIVPKKPTIAPEGVDNIASKLDAVLLSHAHFDHSGYLPRLERKGYNGHYYMTQPTRDIAYKLWLDHLKIEGRRHWTEHDLDAMYRKIITKPYHKKFKIADGITAEFYNAGHVLGAAQILIDWDGTLILYTGDINNRITPMFDGYEVPDKDISVLISESTNGNRYVPERHKVDVGLRLLAKQVTEGGNKFILPSFAVGRSQELLITLAMDETLDDVPIYMDGMIIEMNLITESYMSEQWMSPRFLAMLKEKGLTSPFRKENFYSIKSGPERPYKYRRMIAKQGKGAIIVSTSGMLEGGPIHTYLDLCAHNEGNVIGITGYQVEGTTGREIVDGARTISIYNDRNKPKKIEIRSKIMKFPYSGHSSVEGIRDYMEYVQADKVVLVHGAKVNQEYILDYVKDVAQPSILKESTPTVLISA